MAVRFRSGACAAGVRWSPSAWQGTTALRCSMIPRPQTRRFSSRAARWYSQKSISDATCLWSGRDLNFFWARQKKASTKACKHIPARKRCLEEIHSKVFSRELHFWGIKLSLSSSGSKAKCACAEWGDTHPCKSASFNSNSSHLDHSSRKEIIKD